MNPDCIVVGTHGELRYHAKSKNIVAFCAEHRDIDCRRSRTCIPNLARAGQGRPIGLLTAWLRDPESHIPELKRHVHPLAARRAARQFFQDLPGAAAFSQNERCKRDGEDDEPENIP